MADYLVVEESTKEDLRETVQEKLNDGWSLQGGVSKTKNPGHYRLGYRTDKTPHGRVETDKASSLTPKTWESSYAQALVK